MWHVADKPRERAWCLWLKLRRALCRLQPWLTGDEVWAAVEASCQEQFPGCPVAEQLMSLKLR